MDVEFEKKLQILKEDLLIVIRNTESRITTSQNDIFSEIDKKFVAFHNILEENNQRVNNLQEFNSVIKVKILDNYTEMTDFYKNAKEDLHSYDIKLANFQKEMKSAFSKYDKIIVENLQIPGTIGDFCKYKNLREYIETNIANITELKNHKDKFLSEAEYSKVQLNNTLKTFNYQIETSEKKNKEIISQNLKKFEEELREEMNSFKEQIDRIKVENGRYHLEAMNKVKEIKGDVEAAKALKENLTDICEKEIERVTNLHTVSYDGVVKDINSITSQLANVSTTARDNKAMCLEAKETLKSFDQIKTDLKTMVKQIMDNTLNIDKITEYLNSVNIIKNNNNSTPSIKNGQSASPDKRKPARKDTKKVDIIDQGRSFKKSQTLRPFERIQIDAESGKRSTDNPYMARHEFDLNFNTNMSLDVDEGTIKERRVNRERTVNPSYDLEKHKIIFDEEEVDSVKEEDEDGVSELAKNEPLKTEPNLGPRGEISHLESDSDRERMDKTDRLVVDEIKKLDGELGKKMKQSSIVNVNGIGMTGLSTSATALSKIVKGTEGSSKTGAEARKSQTSFLNLAESYTSTNGKKSKADDKISLEDFRKNHNSKLFVSTKHQPIVINMKDLLAENQSEELNKYNTINNLPNIKNTEKKPNLSINFSSSGVGLVGGAGPGASSNGTVEISSNPIKLNLTKHSNSILKKQK